MCRFAVAWAFVAAVWPALASARPEGVAANDCNGCHRNGKVPDVDVTFAPGNPQLGATVELTIAIEAINGRTGGIYVRTNGAGRFVITDPDTKLFGEDGFMHKQPKSASGGTVTFRAQWIAPSDAPGGVQFDIATLSSNDNDNESGDGGLSLSRSFAFGCPGTTYFRDFDGDGIGSSDSGTFVACALPFGFSATDGDCDDNDERRLPGAQELCNGIDDDCNMQVDDGLESVQVYPDADHDGYGGRNGTPVTGCAGSGYGIGNNDCNDGDPAVFPGNKEVCDYKDNDCDGDVDERVKPQCGVGRCVRESFGCDDSMCYPGEERTETCNLLDDDCNGIVDDEGSCADGQVCDNGVCKAGGVGAGDDVTRTNKACAGGGDAGSTALFLVMAAIGRGVWRSRSSTLRA